VCFHTTFGEKAKRLTSIGVFFDPEDLYFHAPREANVTIAQQRRWTANRVEI
jgi:hypothetical protein